MSESATQESLAWETVIGLEVHCQLATTTKLFCGCPTTFGLTPNAATCPVCLGHPGTLPALNAAAVRLAVRVGLALGCELQTTSVFARKSYFYADLPKGYQISQYERPICLGGGVPVDLGELTRTFPLTRIHMEEDAGKLIHGERGTEIDLNRAGTPLIEIVSEPTLRSGDEAAAYLKELRAIVMALGACDGHLEQGSFRCDANVSVRRPGAPLGTKVELKNLNSFGFVKRAIEYEASRQIAAIEAGERIVQETRLWDEATGRTRAMRGKEDAHDYRYFPDPDLLPLVLPSALVDAERAALPELPGQRRARYRDALGLGRYDAEVLTVDEDTSRYFDAVLATGADPKTAANWVNTELKGRLDGRPLTEAPVTAEALGQLLAALASGRISGKLAKDAFAKMCAGDSVAAALAAVGEQVSDVSAIDAAITAALDATPGEVAAFHGGKTKVVGFFVGQVMKAMKGRANPELVNSRLLVLLEARRQPQ